MDTSTQKTERQPAAIEHAGFRDPADLKPHPSNPRGEVDPNSPEVIELSEDIRRRGILQPILIDENDTILAGHRRRVAAIRAGLTAVPTMLRKLSGREYAEEFFLAENMKRRDLSPLEEARTIAALHKKLENAWKRKVTLADLARRLDMPSATVAVRLAILELPASVQRLFHLSELPLQASRQLERLKDWPEEAEKFAQRLVTRQVSLKSLPKIISGRIEVLDRERADADEKKREARAATRTKPHTATGAASAPTLTRDGAVEALRRNATRRISLANVSLVLATVCCHCGMIGANEVCNQCPLPKFVSGIVGRSDGGDGDDE